ncbi:MAG: hypothetical protein M3R27_10930 [Bacteroidota bacterium]|nr:hypothetical protein [Bacteroidota bacterium]
MKAQILFFLLLPLSLFSQKKETTAVEKPSTNACPEWKKKKSSSKAEYFNYLRTPRSKQVLVTESSSTSFYQPKYLKPSQKPQTTTEEYPAVSSRIPVESKAPKSEGSEIAPEVVSTPTPELKVEENVKENTPEMMNEAPETTSEVAEGNSEQKKYKRSRSGKKIRLFKGKHKGVFKRNKAASCPSF